MLKKCTIIDVTKRNINEEIVKVRYVDGGSVVRECFRTLTKPKGEGTHKRFLFFREVYELGSYCFKDGEFLYKFSRVDKKYVEDSDSESLEKSFNEVEKQDKEQEKVRRNEDGEVIHKEYDTILECVKNNIPVFLTGPAGSGKNHVLEQVAWDLDLEFYFTNSVQQEYKLTGFIDAGGKYHETEFYKAFKNGGLFFLDEMDASIPEVLVLLNAAIANGYFEFPSGRINANEKFRVVAAGNTVGQGADELYVGRLQLDQATLDRFVIIEFDYDENIELDISKGNHELVLFIHDLREQSKLKGISTTFSYRCISMVTKLERGSLELEKILKISVFKGLDKDTINTFDVNGTDKYWDGLKKIKEI